MRKKRKSDMNKHLQHDQTHHVKKLSIVKKRHGVTAVIFAAIIALVGVSFGFVARAAAAGTLYFAPNGGTYTVGQHISVAVRENSGGTGVYSAQASFSYPQGDLQFNSISTSGTAFAIDPSQSVGGSGHVLIVLASKTAVTTDQLIGTVDFTVLAAGTANLTPDPVCSGSVTTNCNSVYDVNINNAITSASNASFTLQAAATTPPSGGGTTPPSGGTTTTPTGSTTTSSGGSASKSNSTSITPQSSNSSITAPDNSQVQVSTPATIEPATIQADGVKKINYYLNNKLVYTATNVPFAYHFDTNHLLNGTYTLKTVSYYTSGRTATSTQKLVVSNPFSFTQFGLLVGHYAGIIIPLLVIVIVLLIVWLGRDRWHRWFKRPRFGASGRVWLYASF